MPKTDAQRAADDDLEAAVSAIVAAYGLLGGALLIDYLLIVEGHTFDGDGELDDEHFGLAFRHGRARTTVAIGLLAKGAELLDGGGIPDE